MTTANTADSSPSAAPTRPRGYTEIGYVFAAVGAFLFATKGIAIKLAYEAPIDAATLLAIRMAMAVPVYLVIGVFALREKRRTGALPTAGQALKAALVGALGYWAASYTDFLGLSYISAQFERLILFTYPLFVVLFGAAFFGLPVRWRAVGAFGLSYLGLAVIFIEKSGDPGSHVALGAGLVLVSAVFFALYQLLAKETIALMGPRLFTCIAMTGAAIGCFAQFLVTEPLSALDLPPRVWEISLYLAIGSTVLPTFFLNAALHRISAQANSTIATLSPVITVVLAVIVLGEHLTVTDIAGTAMVLAGVGSFTLADRKRG
ncbi:MAG TPA: DMT family transporter [Bauldia sp.]|nr:DMT family transporter [Bauldia sp.]